jgi:hypothetical protein
LVALHNPFERGLAVHHVIVGFERSLLESCLSNSLQLRLEYLKK